MSIRRGVAVAIAAALIASAALAGCSDDETAEPNSGLPSESEQSDPTSPTPEPSDPTPTEPSSSGPQAPEIPDAAKAPGRSGARAFVEFYVDLENYAKDTGNVQPLRQYSHPQCGGCNDLIRFYRDWYQRGGWFQDGDRTITSFARVIPTVPPHDIYARISGIHKAGKERERRGAPTVSVGRETYTLLFWLLREPNGWQVSRLDTP